MWRSPEGGSDIYDILTHLTFLYIEAQKICSKVLIEEKGETVRDWQKLEEAVNKTKLSQADREVALIHVANILGRSFVETMDAYTKFSSKADPERFLKIIYWMGKLAIEEITQGLKRTITFSTLLRERLGHHIHGELWANTIKTRSERKRDSGEAHPHHQRQYALCGKFTLRG